MATTGTPASRRTAAGRVADGRRPQKVRHVAVVDRRVELDRFADRTQAGAEDDAAPRRLAPAAANVRGGFVDLCSEMLHSDFTTEDTEDAGLTGCREVTMTDCICILHSFSPCPPCLCGSFFVFAASYFSTPQTIARSFGAGGVGGGDDLFDVHRLGVVGVAHVGDDREAERAQAAVDGDDRFGNRRHADDVGADAAQEAVLGPRFQVRAGDGDRHAAMGDEVFLAGDFEAGVDQLRIVRLPTYRGTAGRGGRR